MKEQTRRIFKFEPTVFAVGDTYQIFVPVKAEVLMWIRVGDELYYDDSNGIIKSATDIHKIEIPMDELDREKEYTVCWRKIIERKPYYTETEDEEQETFNFKPVCGNNINAYHIADAHNMVDKPVIAAQTYADTGKELDFLILNGDIPNHSGEIRYFDNIYEICALITHGNIPVVFSRGNHDTRGIYAENIAEYTPCQNGNSFYSFRLGSIWGLVLDCGEDKDDSHISYGHTICCHNFRKKETKFIENIIKNADNEYCADGVKHRIVVVHNPFTRKYDPPFNIEEEIYEYWVKLLRESIKPEVIICGHKHMLKIINKGDEFDAYGQPCPVVIGSVPEDFLNEQGKQYFAGCGYNFTDDKIEVTFTDSKEKIIDTSTLKI